MKIFLLGGLSIAVISTTVAVTSCANTTSSPETSANQTTVAQDTVAALKSGTFQPGEHPTSGSVRLVRENDQDYLEFGDDFTSDSGPDLFVILHRSDDVIGTSEPPAYGLTEGDYVVIAPLENVEGAQRYLIPEEVDISEYQSVAIWCRQFNATFGAASLSS